LQKQHYSIHINASVERAWDTMLNDPTYREWTKAFSPGSYYKGSWDQGSKMLFLGPDPETGKEGGMVSRIKENRPHEFISIEHLGVVHDGVEDTKGEEAKKWAPAYENYTFRRANGGTELSIDVETADEYAADFERMWPEALKSLKALAETS
jgi:L-rhamnose mutarotase